MQLRRSVQETAKVHVAEGESWKTVKEVAKVHVAEGDTGTQKEGFVDSALRARAGELPSGSKYSVMTIVRSISAC